MTKKPFFNIPHILALNHEDKLTVIHLILKLWRFYAGIDPKPLIRLLLGITLSKYSNIKVVDDSYVKDPANLNEHILRIPSNGQSRFIQILRKIKVTPDISTLNLRPSCLSDPRAIEILKEIIL